MTDQIIIDIIGQLALIHPHIDQRQTREMLRNILDDYNIEPKSKALALNSNGPQLVRLYLATRRLDGLSEKTLLNYKYKLGIFFSWVPLNVEDITVMDIRKFLAAYGMERNIKRSSLNTFQTAIKTFFDWLEKEDHITKSPARKLQTMKLEKRTRKALNDEQLERLRNDGCSTSRDRAILEIFFSTGARVSEIQQINIKDINWADNSVSVIGKGNKERTIYFNDKARMYIKRYLKERKSIESPALFVSNIKPYGRLSTRSLQETIKAIGQRAELDISVFPHILRHTMATMGYKSGIPLPIIQELLGHEDPSTTQTYAALDKTSVREAHRKHMSI